MIILCLFVNYYYLSGSLVIFKTLLMIKPNYENFLHGYSTRFKTIFSVLAKETNSPGTVNRSGHKGQRTKIVYSL